VPRTSRAAASTKRIARHRAWGIVALSSSRRPDRTGTRHAVGLELGGRRHDDGDVVLDEALVDVVLDERLVTYAWRRSVAERPPGLQI
jgi:hypothetical protein